MKFDANDYMPTKYKLNKLVTKDVWIALVTELKKYYGPFKSKNYPGETYTNKYYNPEIVKNITGEEINSGLCHFMSHAIHKIHPEYKSVSTDDFKTELFAAGVKLPSDHAFLVKNKKFYDAEVPDGVDNVWRLPFFIRFMQRKAKRSEIKKEKLLATNSKMKK